jgi:hypothetical protein
MMRNGRTSRDGVVLVALLVAAIGGFPGGAGLSARSRDGQRPTAPAPPLETTARLIGRVIAADTDAPVRGARVTLTSANESLWIATTDDEGRYDIRDLPAGQFILRIAKAGFVEATPPYVVLKNKLVLDSGDIALIRGGVIVGRLTDALGEPVVEVTVGAARVIYRTPGNRGLIATQSTRTNDLGEFRLYGLQPGNYFVYGGVGGFQVSAGAGAGEPRVTYAAAGSAPATTFFPGTVTVANAQLVKVAAGESSHAHFQLVALPLATLSGRVLDSQGRPFSGAMILLSAQSPEAALVFSGHGVEVDALGQFRLNNIQPGEYRADVVSREALERVGRTGTFSASADEESASVALSVAGDVKDLVIYTSRGFVVHGRVIVDGAPPPASWLPGLAVQGRGSPMTPGSPGQVDAQGTFAVRGVSGPRSIRVSGLPAGAVVERVLAHGRDITDDGMVVDADIAGVEISITTTPPILDGRVIDDRGEPARGYAIVFADDPALWVKPGGRFVKIAEGDAAKGFRIAGLPPGRYRAVALADRDELEWASPENLERLRPGATPVALVKGQTQSVTLVRR